MILNGKYIPSKEEATQTPSDYTSSTPNSSEAANQTNQTDQTPSYYTSSPHPTDIKSKKKVWPIVLGSVIGGLLLLFVAIIVIGVMALSSAEKSNFVKLGQDEVISLRGAIHRTVTVRSIKTDNSYGVLRKEITYRDGISDGERETYRNTLEENGFALKREDINDGYDGASYGSYRFVKESVEADKHIVITIYFSAGDVEIIYEQTPYYDEVYENSEDAKDSSTDSTGDNSTVSNGNADGNNSNPFADELSGKTWDGDDGSELILRTDGSFSWYKDPDVHDDNYYEGKYQVLVGDEGIDYMVDHYGDKTRVIKEQIHELMQTEKYKNTEFYVLVLDHTGFVMDGEDKMASLVTTVAPYYGFYVKDRQWFNSVNQLTDNTSNFRLKD
ncbi:hypothetical protein FACS1894111_08610 [Clostridia bacterium]|nr:hypothetical protein FACS1894111_08610 [Clostridia bacterium]